MRGRDARQLAHVRLAEARALLSAARWDGAYYIAGYAVEHALKAVIIKRSFSSGEWPDRQFVARVHSHDLSVLLQAAGLRPDLERDMAADRRLETYWGTVKLWSAEARYAFWSEPEARDMVAAVGQARSGVLKWIRRHW